MYIVYIHARTHIHTHTHTCAHTYTRTRYTSRTFATRHTCSCSRPYTCKSHGTFPRCQRRPALIICLVHHVYAYTHAQNNHTDIHARTQHTQIHTNRNKHTKHTYTKTLTHHHTHTCDAVFASIVEYLYKYTHQHFKILTKSTRRHTRTHILHNTCAMPFVLPCFSS